MTELSVLYGVCRNRDQLLGLAVGEAFGCDYDETLLDQLLVHFATAGSPQGAKAVVPVGGRYASAPFTDFPSRADQSNWTEADSTRAYHSSCRGERDEAAQSAAAYKQPAEKAAEIAAEIEEEIVELEEEIKAEQAAGNGLAPPKGQAAANGTLANGTPAPVAPSEGKAR